MGIEGWDALATLGDDRLSELALTQGASVVTLRRLRGQARLVVNLDLQPAEAALLLHAGIADARALARAQPQELWVQTGRLQRRLTGSAVSSPDLATVTRWIQRARRGTN